MFQCKSYTNKGHKLIAWVSGIKGIFLVCCCCCPEEKKKKKTTVDLSSSWNLSHAVCDLFHIFVQKWSQIIAILYYLNSYCVYFKTQQAIPNDIHQWHHCHWLYQWHQTLPVTPHTWKLQHKTDHRHPLSRKTEVFIANLILKLYK